MTVSVLESELDGLYDVTIRLTGVSPKRGARTVVLPVFRGLRRNAGKMMFGKTECDAVVYVSVSGVASAPVPKRKRPLTLTVKQIREMRKP